LGSQEINLRNIIFLSWLLIVALASCTLSSATTPTATITAFPTIEPTSTNTPTAKPSATITPTASKTPSPTATFEPIVMDSKVSPNGEYVAYAYDFYWNYHQTIEIKDKEGKLIWRIPYQGELPNADPHPYMGIDRWSNDSSQLYFCYSWASDGGDPPIQISCYNLQQLDIKTGKVQSVVISPDESHVGYIVCQDESCIIHVQNISTGFDKTASIVFESYEHLTQLWNIDWYADPGFVFHLQNKNHIIQTIYLNVLTMKYVVIKKYPAPPIPGWADFQGWVDENTLEFLESGNEGVQVIHIDIRNGGTIVIGTLTPTPTPNY
jgi:hypothetical protein